MYCWVIAVLRTTGWRWRTRRQQRRHLEQTTGMKVTITRSERGAALRKSAIADATRQTLPRACRSILASQVDFSRNHSATYVFHGFSSSQPPRPSEDTRSHACLPSAFDPPSTPASRRCKFFKLGNSRNYFSHLLHCFSSNIFVIRNHAADTLARL